MDTPARAFIKCCIGHCGYASCEKCTVWGTRANNRTVYLDLNAPLRTDESFRNQEQPYHHKGVSPLLRLKTGLVSQFRLDSMHLVYEGVFKRLLEAWIYWPGSWKFHLTSFKKICITLKQIKSSCLQDFNRPPRSLEELNFFKATEFRRLCVYDGVRVFKEIPDKNVYKHYLLLHCGIYILAGPFHQTLNNFANKLLRTFIQHAAEVFGDKFIVYNVHALCHLADECTTHGTLDSFSAFKFENRLKSIKEALKSGFRPLEQVAKREMQKGKKKVYLQSASNKVSLLKRHVDPNETLQGSQYRRIIVNDVLLSTSGANNCIKTVRDEIILLKNIINTHDGVYIVGNMFSSKKDFYTYPVNSSELGIFEVSKLEQNETVINISSIVAKCWLIPTEKDKLFCVCHYCILFLFINSIYLSFKKCCLPHFSNLYYNIVLSNYSLCVACN